MTERKIHHQPEQAGVRERAADIRRHWTLSERKRRLGLPPDMPSRLQTQFTGRPQRSW